MNQFKIKREDLEVRPAEKPVMPSDPTCDFCGDTKPINQFMFHMAGVQATGDTYAVCLGCFDKLWEKLIALVKKE